MRFAHGKALRAAVRRIPYVDEFRAAIRGGAFAGLTFGLQGHPMGAVSPLA
jgi:hypothetical protein